MLRHIIKLFIWTGKQRIEGSNPRQDSRTQLIYRWRVVIPVLWQPTRQKIKALLKLEENNAQEWCRSNAPPFSSAWGWTKGIAADKANSVHLRGKGRRAASLFLCPFPHCWILQVLLASISTPHLKKMAARTGSRSSGRLDKGVMV